MIRRLAEPFAHGLIALVAKANTCLLNLLIWQKPRERLVVKVDHIDPIAKRIPESAPEARNQLQTIFLRNLFPHLRELFFVPHDKAKMPVPRTAEMINLSHGKKLMIAELEERITFATRFKLEIENIFVKRSCLTEIINFDRHMIAAIDSNAHAQF